ncbi:hypothetical protein CNEO3_110003 [Clostridium neonatale]|nr:hypothetical protein CNEO3_1170001 [Clostridium neonatale]CAI3561047.1 hypothetical protein CNEO3_110003 [Clostridium neonatale]CAI3581789.1 hypothetical protein CNEO3_150001 [Clostridium neonatale]CAI3676422.1 hypothetical protein CNEO3_600037 [Clostridium neonatale]
MTLNSNLFYIKRDGNFNDIFKPSHMKIRKILAPILYHISTKSNIKRWSKELSLNHLFRDF